MEAHYTYFDNIFPQVISGNSIEFAADYQKLLLGMVTALVLILLGQLVVSSRLQEEAGVTENVVPKKKPSLFGVLDFLMESFVYYHDSVAGKENRHHAPFTAAIFFFIFVLNLIGLIPGMPAATTTVWINVAMAIVVFVHFNYHGIKEHGPIGYLKHFLGPLWWLAPLMLVIEVISLSLRILTLNLRLYWNIAADHMVLGIFSNLLSDTFILATPFYFIGLFVSFMQAFVFATLTMIYIVLATEHQEGH